MRPSGSRCGRVDCGSVQCFQEDFLTWIVKLRRTQQELGGPFEDQCGCSPCHYPSKTEHWDLEHVGEDTTRGTPSAAKRTTLHCIVWPINHRPSKLTGLRPLLRKLFLSALAIHRSD